MKSLIFITCLLVSLSIWSQNALPAKPILIEQYCEVIASQTGGLFSYKVNIDVDFGSEMKKEKDNRIKDTANGFKTFNTIVDALNYMGKQGWMIVTVFENGTKGNNTYLLKKLFVASELPENKK